MIISNFDIGIPTNRELIRRCLTVSWEQTYRPQLGDQVARAMIGTLANVNVGGILPDNDEKIIVAKNGSEVVGTCVYATRHGTTYIWGFYVLELAQRCGIGRRMFERVLSDTSGGQRLQVIVLEASEGAISFYKALGFKTLEVTNFELLPDIEVPAVMATLR